MKLGRIGPGYYASTHGKVYDPVEKKKIMENLNKHHMTVLPSSLEKVQEERFSLQQIQNQLHFRLQTLTAKDSARYSEYMQLFKITAKRFDPDDDQQLKIYKADFHHLITSLGVWASQEQADALFDMYDDMDGDRDGTLPIYDFIQRARNPDDTREFMNPEMPTVPRRKGPRLYPDTKLYGTPVEAKLPGDSVYKMTINKLCKDVKYKLEQLSRIGMTNSTFRARKSLTQKFQFYDYQKQGFVTSMQLWRIFHQINFPISVDHLNMLLQRFPGPYQETFSYKGFVRKVYPSKNDEEYTSLNMRDKGAEYWAFMHSIDQDGDGMVSLDEMLAYKNSLEAPATPPPMTPQSDGSDSQVNMMTKIANLSTRAAADGVQVQQQPQQSQPSRSHSRVGTPFRSVNRQSTGQRPRPPSTARASRPATPAERAMLSRGHHTARIRSNSRLSRTSRGGF
jgi:Ca2+-binding EF-hand superfamily protein